MVILAPKMRRKTRALHGTQRGGGIQVLTSSAFQAFRFRSATAAAANTLEANTREAVSFKALSCLLSDISHRCHPLAAHLHPLEHRIWQNSLERKNREKQRNQDISWEQQTSSFQPLTKAEPKAHRTLCCTLASCRVCL